MQQILMSRRMATMNMGEAPGAAHNADQSRSQATNSPHTSSTGSDKGKLMPSDTSNAAADASRTGPWPPSNLQQPMPAISPATAAAVLPASAAGPVPSGGKPATMGNPGAVSSALQGPSAAGIPQQARNGNPSQLMQMLRSQNPQDSKAAMMNRVTPEQLQQLHHQRLQQMQMAMRRGGAGLSPDLSRQQLVEAQRSRQMAMMMQNIQSGGVNGLSQQHLGNPMVGGNAAMQPGSEFTRQTIQDLIAKYNCTEEQARVMLLSFIRRKYRQRSVIQQQQQQQQQYRQLLAQRQVQQAQQQAQQQQQQSATPDQQQEQLQFQQQLQNATQPASAQQLQNLQLLKLQQQQLQQQKQQQLLQATGPDQLQQLQMQHLQQQMQEQQLQQLQQQQKQQQIQAQQQQVQQAQQQQQQAQQQAAQQQQQQQSQQQPQQPQQPIPHQQTSLTSPSVGGDAAGLDIAAQVNSTGGGSVGTLAQLNSSPPSNGPMSNSAAGNTAGLKSSPSPVNSLPGLGTSMQSSPTMLGMGANDAAFEKFLASDPMMSSPSMANYGLNSTLLPPSSDDLVEPGSSGDKLENFVSLL